MLLSPAQLATLKAAIVADGALNALPNNSDGNFAIAVAFNQPASPAFTVWKTSVATDEIMLNGFDWARVDNLTAGKARIWEWMTALGRINPSQDNVRVGVNACFSAGPDSANRLAVFGHSSRLATRLEKLFATGSGTASNDQGVGPGLLVVEGTVSGQDIENARNS